MSNILGVLGGMGPLATVDFVRKIILHTPAHRDQDHIPLLIQSTPQIPDRTACLMGNGDSPLPALTASLHALVKGGVGAIAIPCNTAHYWHQDLAKISPVPILHIAKACARQLQQQGIRSVALMATDGTLKAGFYEKELATFGIQLVPASQYQQAIMEGIYLVKSGAVSKGADILENTMNALLTLGVERVILGCTEIPFALEQKQSACLRYGLDATEALAKACVHWHRELSAQPSIVPAL